MRRRDGKRTKSGRLSRAKLELASRNPPAQHILDRRELFAFVTPTKGPDGRTGEIDQDVCDGIGQLHALGLLDGHDCDPQDMRDKGRVWGDHYAGLLAGIGGAKVSNFERTAQSRSVAKETGFDRLWDKMNALLTHRQRDALIDLLVDPLVGIKPLGQQTAYWAQALIDEALLKRGKIRKHAVIRMPGAIDHDRMADAIEGLCALCAGTEQRRAA